MVDILDAFLQGLIQLFTWKAFTLQLAGIAIGSGLAAPILRMKRNWLTLLTVIQAAIGVAAVLSFNALTRSQQAIDSVTPWFTRLGLNTYLAPLVASSASVRSGAPASRRKRRRRSEVGGEANRRLGARPTCSIEN